MNWLLVSHGDAFGAAQRVPAGNAAQPDLPTAVIHPLPPWGRWGYQMHFCSLISSIYAAWHCTLNPCWFCQCVLGPLGFPLLPVLLPPQPGRWVLPKLLLIKARWTPALLVGPEQPWAGCNSLCPGPWCGHGGCGRWCVLGVPVLAPRSAGGDAAWLRCRLRARALVTQVIANIHLTAWKWMGSLPMLFLNCLFPTCFYSTS